MKHLFLTLVLSISFISVQAQSVLGTWKTISDEDNLEKSHIEIYEENGKYYGKVIKLLSGATITHCDNCTGDKKGAPLEGMVILYDMEKEGGSYENGEIFDPAKGKAYSCTMKLESADKLYVRGYIGFSLLGRTQYWYRVQ